MRGPRAAGGGRRVLGVEVSAPAIAGARRAAALMGLSAGQVRFEAGDARVLDPGRGAAPDLLVVNPPRRGIGAELAGRIEASGVRRVLYSSCNPQSLAQGICSEQEALEVYYISCAVIDIDHFMERSYLNALGEALKLPQEVREDIERDIQAQKQAVTL